MIQSKFFRGNIKLLSVCLGILSLFSLLLFAKESTPVSTVQGGDLDLTAIFENQLVKDTNNDAVPDDISARFLISNRTAAIDVEAAAAAAARLGFESSAMDASLCVSSRDEAKKKRIDWLIVFSTIKNKTGDKKSSDLSNTQESCGVRVYREKGLKVIDIFGASPPARRYAAVNFFSRFPYIWDITGRETGELWHHVKQHILSQLPEPDRKNSQVSIKAVHYLYEKPEEESMRQRRLQRSGLAGTMRKKGAAEKVEIKLVVPENTKNSAEIFENLISAHKKGESTNILNYAGVKNVEIHILAADGGKKEVTITIPRTAFPQRFLNPATDPFFFRKKATIKNINSDIAGFYTNKGIYMDTDNDGLSDRLVSRIVYEGSLPYQVINLAARFGLEECAVSLPFIIPAENLDEKTIKNIERPVLIGSSNRFTDYLMKVGKAKIPQLQQDEGCIRFCAGFNPGGAYIVSGSTSAGENAALQYAAAVLPFISAAASQAGAAVWQDLNRDIELFFSRKSDAGIAAFGILQLDRQKKMFAAPDLERAETLLYTMRCVKNLDQFISNRIKSYLPGNRRMFNYDEKTSPKNKKNNQKFCGGPGGDFLKEPPGRRRQEKDKFLVKSGGRLSGVKGFTDTFSPTWEVAEAREIFTNKILPKLRNLKSDYSAKGAALPTLFIDLRLSEPQEVLKQQAAWLLDMTEAAGFRKEEVKIRALCAYKQGFHWIKDHVIHRLKNNPPVEIKIRFAPFPVDFKETRKYRPEPVRWLQELYPIDEILARELDIPLEAIHFIKDEKLKEAVHELSAIDGSGEEFFNETFSPFTTEIPFQSRFKEWGKVMVCTGGIRVRCKNEEIFSAVINTDPLRLWNHYQGKILPDLTKLVEKKAGGPLKLEDQPFFDKLQIKVWMSEPDYRLGLDEELVSSLESFHEDIYFNTLDYFQGVVKKDPEMDVADPLMAQRWAAPGNIVPIIHPSRTGQGPLMETEVTALESLSPLVEMKFHYYKTKEPVKITKKISPLKKQKAPRLTGIVIDSKGLAKEAEYTLEFGSEGELSDAVDMLRALKDLQKQKVLPNTFSYPGLSAIKFTLTAPKGLQTQFTLNLPAPGTGADKSFWESKTLFSKRVLAAGGKEFGKDELEKALAKVMSPEETLTMANRLGTFPEINTYISGYSYQGRPVPVLEIGLKPKGKITSRRKITTFKPTIFILGRQHANEISSTNYGFNIAYLLAKDPGYRKYLERLNIVIEPMENPDGSALAVELQKLTPHHMLHAGRYSALGTDIGYHVNKPDTLITEAKVRKKLYDRWQPDIFLNNHGYPSHEWVQQFSNYTPYLFRAYWVPRGWYYFHTGLDTIGAPLHKEAGERIVKIISQKMKGDEEVFETNRRIYDRYRRWAERWQPHIHYLELYDGTNIYKKRRGSTAARLSGRRKITVLEAIPEAMDETARDEWLQLSIRQGTLFVTSFMDLAIESQKPIERIEEEAGNVVRLQVIRHRPLRTRSVEER